MTTTHIIPIISQARHAIKCDLIPLTTGAISERESSKTVTEMPDENEGQKEPLHAQEERLESVCFRASGCTTWQCQGCFSSQALQLRIYMM